jgi:DNA ligase-1
VKKNPFKPMLADNADLKIQRYPLIASPKLDGVRATFVNGELLTRSLKLIPNAGVSNRFKSDAPLDGELIVGAPNGPTVFRDTMKVVMSHAAPVNDLAFHVFDVVYEGSFKSRLFAAHSMCDAGEFFVPVPHIVIENEAQLLNYEEGCLNAGFEGAMIRDPEGKYKFGRATTREGTLLKLKRKMTSEAQVIGFVEQMHNGNVLLVDNLGYADRQTLQANMVPMNTLGALEVRDIKTNVEFNVGTGFTFADRDEIWKNREKYKEAILTYEYLPYGVKDKPRHPVWLGWRAKEDL